ncbi:MAG: PTS sugar transporter subunit IIB [bacterium]|nr:PTS sugar transporter subunit IIB [bacterium]
MMMHNPVFIFRVDNRLIHGQVIVGWAKTLNLNKIVVANDELSRDTVKLQMLKFAIPQELSVDFFTLEQTVEAYQKEAWQKLDTMLLVKYPKDAYELVSRGIHASVINIGGLYMEDGCQMIAENISVNQEEKEFLEKLLSMNIRLEGRALPMDEELDVNRLLQKFK